MKIVGVGNRNSKEMDCHPDAHTLLASGHLQASYGSGLFGWLSFPFLVSLLHVSQPCCSHLSHRQMGLQTPAETPPPCQPQTDRQAGRHARQAICLVVFFERGRLQGDAYRVCLGPHPAHHVTDTQAGGGSRIPNTEGWSPASASKGLGMGFTHHPR